MTEVAQPTREPWTIGSTASPMQTFDHGSISRRDTASTLADDTQRVTRSIAEILNNRYGNIKRIGVIADVDEMLQAVKIRLPDESSLILAMKKIQSDSIKLKIRLMRRDKYWLLWLALDPGLNKLTLKLSDAVQNLKLVRFPSLQRQTMSGHPDLWLTM
jgi:hypothetical protein